MRRVVSCKFGSEWYRDRQTGAEREYQPELQGAVDDGPRRPVSCIGTFTARTDLTAPLETGRGR
jgi:hypothetical protein